MFELKTVYDCPVTRGSLGVMTMPPDLIGMIAGAVRDKVEWAVLLNGTRSEDGYEVTVERFTVPVQERSGTHAVIREVELADDVVGVMHSHHTMGAFFSTTDKNTLNPRFPSSIVVAVENNNLGFKYEAVGKVILPCGGLGEVKFRLAVAGVKRFAAKAIRGQHGESDSDLKGCLEYQMVGDEWTYSRAARCGIESTVEYERPMVFGLEGGLSLLDTIKANTRKAPRQAGFTAGKGLPPSQFGGKGKKGKKGKKAYRNGLQKLARPDEYTELVDFDEGGIQVLYFNRQCDSCNTLVKKVRLHDVFQQKLCSSCWDEANQIVEEIGEGAVSDLVKEERESSLITLDMEEVDRYLVGQTDDLGGGYLDGGNGVLTRITDEVEERRTENIVRGLLGTGLRG